MKRMECHHNIFLQGEIDPKTSMMYTTLEANLMAKFMTHYNQKQRTDKKWCYSQQYMLQKGLKVFKEPGAKAASAELKQQHDRVCFRPIKIADMSEEERRKAQEALMFLTEKRTGEIKGRMVYNGKPTREWLSKEDSASPTASLEAIFTLAAIDAHEGRDVMTADIPNAFIQTEMPDTPGKDKVIMKITGVLVDMLVQLDPITYEEHVVFEKNRKVLYVQVLRAIYGMLNASLLWYKRFRSDLESIDFKFNPYDPCVANREKNGAQHTIRFHVDDIMSSHVNSKVNDKFAEWLNKAYGKHKPVEPTRGKIHEYLGMTFDFNVKGKVKIGMIDYVKSMIEDFPEEILKSASTPASEKLFDKGQGGLLNKSKKEAYHNTVAKGLFLCKRARPDIQLTIASMTTRVLTPNESDWLKVKRLLQYLKGTMKKVLTLSIDNLRVIKWYVDVSFAVHPDFKSHTGATMVMGSGGIISMSRKQKLNTRSSTEAELVGADDAVTMILWTRLFLEEQGYQVEKNILYQDNKSAILLETNGAKSAGKRSRALNVRYFFLADQVEKGLITIEYCPTEAMLADYMTKPLQGEKFKKFRDSILGA